MSPRTALVALSLTLLTLGCFDQLKSDSSSEQSNPVETNATDRDEEDCDWEWLRELEEACGEGDEEACEELEELLEESSRRRELCRFFFLQ